MLPGEDVPDLHKPKPLTTLLCRETIAFAANVFSSMRLRLAGLTRGTYIHPRARLIRADRIRIEAHCQIYDGATLRAASPRWPALSLGRYTIVRENAYLDAHGGLIDLADGVFVGQNVVVYGQGGVHIGANTLLSPGVTIISAQHRFAPSEAPIKFQPEAFAEVSVGEGCWLGANAVVLAGVKIGKGTVVGAGSVVTHDLPEGVVAYGVPARVTRPR